MIGHPHAFAARWVGQRKGGRQGVGLPFILAVFLLGAGSSGASDFVDQQQPVIDAGAPRLTIGGETDQRVAQVVTSGTSSPLTDVNIPVGCDAGDLFVEIQEAAAGAPGGTLIASTVISGSALPSGAPTSFRRIALWPPAAVGSGRMFAIVLRSSGVCGIFQGPTGNPYPGGAAFVRSGGTAQWSRLTVRADLPFQTIVATDPFGGDLTGGHVSARCFVESLRK
jgi:hypothetical protein